MMQGDGYFRTPYDFFASNKKNLHVVLGMDSVNLVLEYVVSRIGIIHTSEVIWMGEWNSVSMASFHLYYYRINFLRMDRSAIRRFAQKCGKYSSINERLEIYAVDFVVFLKTFETLYAKKHGL